MFNKRKKTEQRLKKEQIQGTSLITYTDPKSLNAEQFRTIRTNIEFAQLDKPMKNILVSSSIPAEGKSTIASNLAYVIAQTDKRVLLVDADLRKPTVHRTFKLNNEQGLTTLLTNVDLKFNQVVQHSRDLNLYFLPSGPIPPNPSEILGSGRMTLLMQELGQYFDIVIYDAPPITAVTDPQILATKVDGVVIIVRQGYSRKEEVKKAKEALENVNANILGYVMNGKELSDSAGYYTYYGYENND
ncbi:CpsD/CapB family tyrosine-protein kinase [Fundicoccus ignavus]|uniref:Tyrosine-protein kinase CpsD n=1 Tax=Fundicoccus ignavus TaxID=2664442 RepID=A0A844CGR1_9LACT|nr:CpsD/CapB family tyrosine-protein kinase [Fundicoccus ignavus]MRJ46905.1 polysaccharide biosynthesis tyrosine autokinase [Fundicoccus ignavus]